MRRAAAVIALLAAVGVIAAVVVFATRGPTPAKVDPKPNGLASYGFSDGFGADLSSEDQDVLLERIHQITGDGGIVSAPLRWDGTRLTSPDWEKYDEFLDRVREHHLEWLPEINIAAGNGSYLLPEDAVGGIAAWTAAVQAIGEHYGPGGLYSQSSAVRAQFPGIVRYQIWNEPNSGTGNATSGHDASVDLDPDAAVEIVRTGVSGLRAAAEEGGWSSKLDAIGWGIGTIDLAYVQRLHEADPAIFREVDTIAFHVYGSVNPLTCPTISTADSDVERTQAGRCIRSLQDVRDWLNTHGGQRVHLAITEGGYSGSDDDCVPPNVVDEKTQANDNRLAVDWLRTYPSLRMDVYLPYHVLDTGSVTYSGAAGGGCDDKVYDQGYWQDNLGMVSPDGTLKRVGRSFRAQIAKARREAGLAAGG